MGELNIDLNGETANEILPTLSNFEDQWWNISYRENSLEERIANARSLAKEIDQILEPHTCLTLTLSYVVDDMQAGGQKQRERERKEIRS